MPPYHGENGENEFVFYDGPPFANGLPHYGHLLTGYVKDIVPRYQTMRGKRVERRFGWDTHGLPAELEAMRQLGLKTTDEIVEMGIDKFNAASRASVLKYTGEWRDYVTRQARWVDFDHDYKTLNPDYMESVIWAFKTLYDKGLVYEGFRVLPYCWNDETPLSNHELRMDDDVYQDRQDPSVTVGFEVISEGDFKGAKLLIWTTNLNWSGNRNRILKLGINGDDIFPGPWFLGQTNILRVGEPIGSFWGYKRLGTWGSDEAAQAAEFNRLPGDIKWADLNSDGILDAQDETIIGRAYPKWTMNISNTFSPSTPFSASCTR